MRVAGWHGTTLVDFPSRVASILFLAGCNLRCPFCHNPGLVLPELMEPAAAEDFDVILKKLEERRGFISGVVFTGGEPLLQPDLDEALLAVRDLGLAVKLDTNGTHPEALARVLNRVDYVALDLKTAPDRYPEATGGRSGFEPVGQTLELLVDQSVVRGNGFTWEARTTLVPGLVGLEDLRALAPLAAAAPLWALQPFVPRGTLDPAFSQLSAMPVAEVRQWVDQLRPVVGRVIFRSN